LLAEAKLEIDSVGYNAAASGKDMRAMSGVALENRKVASQTELAPMFDVLKHMDIRVYRKIWNRIKQYWKEEKWLRVTDDEINLRWVGLNAPMTKGQMLLEQAKEQKLPPEQLQQLQMQIQSDPMMNEVVDTKNDIAELDVDIVIDDAPDTVTMQVEEFQMLGEMVKSGVPIPPTAIIQASNLKDKHKILEEMRNGMQVPPEVKEELKKLTEENQALKADQQVEGAKLQQKSEAQKAELMLKKELQDGEIQLERAKAQAEIELKRAVAEAELQIDGAKLKMQEEHEQKKIQLEGVKMEAEHQRETKKMEFEEKAKANELMPDEDFKQYYANKVAQTDVMPSLMKGLTDAFGQMQQALEQIATLQGENLKVSQATLQAIEKPKAVSISGVRKDEFGQVTGATVTTH
jgi:hypothetical protein